MRRSILPVALALVATLPACRACKNDHPFVPYRIEAGAGSAPPATDAAAPSPALDAGSARETAVVAPPHATSWSLGTLALTAPAGWTFRQGLAWDVDGDGREDALVLAETGEEHAEEGLYFYRGVAEGTPVGVRVSLADDARVEQGPRCARVEHLARVGKRSASVEIGRSCPKDGRPIALGQGPSTDRIVALVAFSGALRPRVAFTVSDPPDAHALAFELDGADVDGDGLDDATLRVTLEGGGAPFEPSPAVHAVFRWFDRPAGMSREPGEPEKSLHAIAAIASQKATKTKDASSAISLAAAGRFLFQAVCGESTNRRVAPAPLASPLLCEASHALEELDRAEVRASVTLGDTLRAIAAEAAAESPPASRTPARVAEAATWIAGLAPIEQAVSLRAIGAVPLLGLERASWGALRFEPAGTVLVRTPAGVVRVDPVHGDETDATGVTPWPMSVVSPDGKLRFLGAHAPCEGSSLVAELTAADAGEPVALPLPIAPPMVVHCRTDGRGGAEPMPSLPVAWGPGGLEVVVAGSPVLVAPDGSKASSLVQPLGQPVTPGAPRSPDGAVLVVPTRDGILVRGVKTRMLRAKELEHGYAELRDCAVSDDAQRVACVRGGAAFVGVWPPP